jgi:hypothetical protein
LCTMPVCASGVYYFCQANAIQRQHPCKSCKGYLHGGPCSFVVEGEFGMPDALYCVKCAHRENVLEKASPPSLFKASIDCSACTSSVFALVDYGALTTALLRPSHRLRRLFRSYRQYRDNKFPVRRLLSILLYKCSKRLLMLL